MPVADGARDYGTGDAAPIIPHPPLPQSGVLENLTAGYRAARAGPASTRSHQNNAESPYYDRIVKDLNARGYKTADEIAVRPGGWGYTGPAGLPVNSNGVAMAPTTPRQFMNPLGSAPILGVDNGLAWGQREADAMWAAVAKERQKNPDFLKDLPDAATLAARATADRQRTVAQSDDVSDRAGWLGKTAGFIGSFAAAPFEPESYVGGIGGIGGKTVAREILGHAISEAGTNAVSGAAALPGMALDSHNLGHDMTAGEAVQSVAEQAAFGAVAGVATHVAPKLIKPIGNAAVTVAKTALEHLPQPIKDAAYAASLRAGTVQDRAAVHEVRRGYAPFTQESTATPDEVAAIHTTERDADVREASPLHPGGDAPNENRLGAMMASLGMHETAPQVPSPAPLRAGHPSRDPGDGSFATTDLSSRVVKAEGVGKNPMSSASGYGQFTTGTWLRVYKDHFGAGGLSDADILAKRNDSLIGHQMTKFYGDDNGRYLRSRGLEDSEGNRSLAHFLGAGGAAKVLEAAPNAPVESLLSHEAIFANKRVLQGKSASEVIAWAHKRVGQASGEPVARAEAVNDVDPYSDVVPASLPPIEHRSFSPSELITDASAMQYKDGGNLSGVTDRLQGVEQWNPLLSGKVIAWERADGAHVIVDGHQRLGLANRLAENDPSIRLDAVVLRELDGVTAQQARVMGALKNIAEGTGSVIDAARVLRDAPNGIKQLPPRSPLVRAGRGVMALGNDAYGAVLNNVISPDLAAPIGLLAGDRPETHMALVSLLKQSGVSTPGQAETVIRQAMADGFGRKTEDQLGMFGEHDAEQTSLYGPSARILEAAKRQLKAEKRSFKTLTDDASRIEKAGNTLDRAANQAKVVDSDQAIGILDATAHSAGPVRSALLDAARSSLDGANRAGAVRKFLDALDGIDLQAAARGVGEGATNGGISEPSGSFFDDSQAHPELAEGRGIPGGPTAYDEAVSAGHDSLDFSDPIEGAGPKTQTASIEHDLLMDFGLERVDPNEATKDGQKASLKAEAPLRSIAEQDGTMGSPLFDAANQPTFRLSEDGEERTFADILNSADADLNAIEAVRACL